MKKTVEIEGIKYEIVTDYREGFQKEDFIHRYTDYFTDYDYVVGDWAYGKLRLKGFNEKGSKNYKKLNDISMLDEYIEKYCAYGCKYFVLKKINVDKK